MTEQEKRNLFPEGVECICTDFPEGCGGKGDDEDFAYYTHCKEEIENTKFED